MSHQTTNKAIKDQGTVCFFIKEGKVMLILIDYGMVWEKAGQKWTGPGGHIDEGETAKEAAAREIKEEIGVFVSEDDLSEVNLIKTNGINLHIFIVKKWSGEPRPMDPTIKEIKWFDFSEVSYDQMWPDNKDWLPGVLESASMNL